MGSLIGKRPVPCWPLGCCPWLSAGSRLFATSGVPLCWRRGGFSSPSGGHSCMHMAGSSHRVIQLTTWLPLEETTSEDRAQNDG